MQPSAAIVSTVGVSLARPAPGRSTATVSRQPIAIPALFALCTLLAVGCDREPATPPPAGAAGPITVASISPAATDLIVGMGAGDHLVAVSNFDRARSETAHLPTVGDYRTIDWEQLAQLRPQVLIVQFRSDKMPAGLLDRASGYGIEVVNVEINRLSHIYQTLEQLGETIGEPVKALAAADELRARLQAVAARVADRPPVRTLISRTESPLEAVGGGNFLDDVLTIAGGKNVLSGPGYDDNSYPSLDREQILSLNPDAVLNLLPAASPQVVAQAKQFWQAMPVAAQQSGRVYYLTEEYLLWPGLNVASIAERFAEVLHPSAVTRVCNPCAVPIPRQSKENAKVRSREGDAKKQRPVVTRASSPCQLRSDRESVPTSSKILDLISIAREEWAVRDLQLLSSACAWHGLEARVTDARSSFAFYSRLRASAFSLIDCGRAKAHGFETRVTRDTPEAA